MAIIFLILYNLLAPFIAAAYVLFFLISPRRRLLAGLFAELKERFAISPPRFEKGSIWLHAASVGEVSALRLLVPNLREKFPGRQLLITTSTSSGRRHALKLCDNALLLPLDIYPLMSRFISAVKPEILLIAETELWPNMLCAAGSAGVKVVMINARISTKTFTLYRLLGPIARKMLSAIRIVAAQSPDDMKRYEILMRGADKLILTGNIKHDLLRSKPDHPDAIETFFARSGWVGRPVLCAGSTHAEEEPLLLEAFANSLRDIPDLKLILAPRHPETSAATEGLLKARNMPFVRWSSRNSAERTANCLLLDELGWLSDMYYYCDIAFVGGTLDDTGGHNVLEPTIYSKPVLFGPNVKNTSDGAWALVNSRGGYMVRTSADITQRVVSLFKNPSTLAEAGAAARGTLMRLQGGTEKTLAMVTSLLS